MAKIKGSDFPSLDIIRTCITNNPHGFSMAWNEDGKVRNYRTMDPEEALARYAELAARLDPATTGMLFHARIATHGSKKVQNCHCWLGAGLAFAHNGVLTQVPPRDDMTDSETFFRDFFLPVLTAKGWDSAKVLAKVFCGTTNRMSFLGPSGNIFLEGYWHKHSERGAKGVCYYSNTSFVPPIPRSLTDVEPFTAASLFGRDYGVYRRVSAEGTKSAVIPLGGKKTHQSHKL